MRLHRGWGEACGAGIGRCGWWVGGVGAQTAQDAPWRVGEAMEPDSQARRLKAKTSSFNVVNRNMTDKGKEKKEDKHMQSRGG